jgi:acyl-CoA reductase-like NAD-dependent aldehyde dehydrogenase
MTNPTRLFTNFTGGAWQPARRAESFPDENPAARGSVLARFQSSTPADVTTAVDAAGQAFPDWRRASVADRQQLGLRFLQLIGEHREVLARIVSQENGKTIREARAEVESAIKEGAHHVHQIVTFGGHALPAGAIGGALAWAFAAAGARVAIWVISEKAACARRRNLRRRHRHRVRRVRSSASGAGGARDDGRVCWS